MFWRFKLILILIFGLLTSNQAFAELIEVKTKTNIKAVYLIEDPDSDQIRVNPVFLAGEVDFDGPEGLSHFLEHLMFWHADKAGGKEIHGRGGNAWVNGIVTSYINQGITSELEELFEFTRRLLDTPDLEKKFMLDEKRVVEREYDFRIAENPDRKLTEQMRRKLFGDHSAGRSVIGTPQSIRSITLDHAFEFHRKYYNLANMVLLISGNLKPKQVRRLVANTLDDLEAGSANSQSWRSSTKFEAQDAIVELKANNIESHAYKYTSMSQWTGSSNRISAFYTAFLTEKLLNSALKGSLHKPLRLENFVVSGLHSWVDPLIDGQVVFSFNGRPDEGVILTSVKREFQLAIEKIARQGVPVDSLERVRKRLVREAKRRGDESAFILRRSFALLRIGEMPISSEEHLRQLISVTKEDIDGLLRAIARPDRRVDGYLKKGNE